MANPWNRLRDTLPEAPRQVGTVIALNGDGTSNVELVGGGTVRVIGSLFGTGEAVFVKGGRIESAAPSLNIQLIEV